jgi:integrase/recombinase XerD
MENKKFSGNEMRIYSTDGHRLYLNKDERARFLEAAKEEDRQDRIYCSLLHYTGARPSEILQITADRISFSEQSITFRTLKKREYDQRGNKKLPEFRSVPVPRALIDNIDLVFDIRRIQRIGKQTGEPIFTQHRATAWRMVKRVMKRANIKGKQATCKGLRHGFGIAMLSGEKPLPIHILSKLLGHSDSSTTEIYLNAVGEEKHKLVMQAWD